MKRELPKTYNPKNTEDKWYSYWLKHALFHADNKSDKPPYTILIPPPNVTGMLTMGHILNNTIQDLLTRWKRMDGFEALWLPGTDHAGIATQNKVEAALKEEENSTRHDLGREKLIERIWQWKDKYGGIILSQLKKLGASCDWQRERFTMDEGLSLAVREVFVRLYDKKLIYKGSRLINWCPRCQTALADEEAPAVETEGKFWHIEYPVENSDKTIVVSTTRPETMLGDSAVAVHPEDDRYKEFIGKYIILPLVNRRIPVIADEHADPKKGSGAVKITPAHDFDDFEVGQRHGLEQIPVMNDQGMMNDAAGKYKGLERFEARKIIIHDLKALGRLKNDEPRMTAVPHCYRCQTIVEPHLSEQWFVKMRPLAEPAIQAVREGKIHMHPKQWEDTYFHWMENIRDWCISRQIWWGHRIPVYTCDNGHEFANTHTPEKCGKCGSINLQQDSDVLDTWFSSWLWPFSTLGWPEQTDDLNKFFPTQTLVTGPDIIFFWVARMIMASLEFMEEIPFSDVYFNGMIRDLSGRKMSKSLGNSPDPLWLINGADAETVKDFASQNPSYKSGLPAYGADAVRLTMIYQTPLGGDVHFDHTLVEMGQKFCNKLWNASRFILLNLDEFSGNISTESIAALPLKLEDKWIISRLQNAIGKARKSLDSFRCNEMAQILYQFVWSEFCDWYLEILKPRLYNDSSGSGKKTAQTVMLYVLDSIVRLLHPVMPFITEEIWQALPLHTAKTDKKHTIMIQPYPVVNNDFIDIESENGMHLVQKTIGAVRNIRGEMNIPIDRKVVLCAKGPADACEILNNHSGIIQKLANVEALKANKDIIKPEQSASALVEKMELFVPLEGIIDITVEKERITKEIARIEQILKGLNAKLSNPGFTSKAPVDVVEKEKQKRADFVLKTDKLKAILNTLG